MNLYVKFHTHPYFIPQFNISLYHQDSYSPIMPLVAHSLSPYTPFMAPQTNLNSVADAAFTVNFTEVLIFIRLYLARYQNNFPFLFDI